MEGNPQAVEQGLNVQKCEGETQLHTDISMFIDFKTVPFRWTASFWRSSLLFPLPAPRTTNDSGSVSVYSEPNQHLLKISHGTLASCQYFGDATLTVIDVLCIESVVAMVPHNPAHSKDSESHCFLVERPGLDIVILGNNREPVDET